MRGRLAVMLVAGSAWLSPLAAQTCLVNSGSCNLTAGYTTGICGLDDMKCTTAGPNPPQCSYPNTTCGSVPSCRQPIAFPLIDITADPNPGQYSARLAVDARVGWTWEHHFNGIPPGLPSNPNIKARVQWFDLAAAPGQCQSPGNTEWCEYFSSDHFLSFVLETGLSCDEAPYDFGVFSARVGTCEQPCPCPPFGTAACICSPPGVAETWVDINNLPFVVTGKMLGCEPPRKHSCNGDADCRPCIGGTSGGAPGPEGPAPGGKGPAVGVGGGGPGLSPEGSGPGTWLRYQAGGVGNPGSPGWVSWTNAHGRFWSHDFAERIVVDPDDSHVWLLTRFATFREFSTLLPSGLYDDVSPSDEYRQLYRTAGGWELRFLDGTIQYFDNSGLWDKTEDRSGNLWDAISYSGDRVTEVSLPDNRRELFGYSGTGRLESIQVIGTDDATSRIWRYDWVGPDLFQIRRPDGTQWRFTYGRLDLPGYVTLLELVGTGSSQPRIIEGRWEYDADGNVTKFWRGAALFTDPAAIDKWQLSYDAPTVTTVTDPLGGQSTYTFSRDTVSDKERVTNIQGPCPVCGVPPNTAITYDPGHPLRIQSQTEPNGTRTDFTYDANGQLLSKIEGANLTTHPDLPRITEWEYDGPFPALVTRVEGPTRVPDPPSRIVTMDYDAAGNLSQRTSYGYEATYSPTNFALVTAYPDYSPTGRVETIDPPGYGATDQRTFEYDLGDHGGMLVDRRNDPLVGTTQFGYDPFNRQTSSIDPSLVETLTAYDVLDRVTSRTELGVAGTADDRITTYLYNSFGDLWCVKHPAGNAVEYLYDQDVSDDVPNTAARRLVQERRGTANGAATSCLTINSSNPAERRVFTLDGAGHHVGEVRHRGTAATTWAAKEWETHWIYSTMCHLDKTIQAPGQGLQEAVTEYSYDCSGNLENVWDPLHPKLGPLTPPSTSYLYDEIDRLIEVRQPWAGAGGGEVVTSYTYDVQDHLVGVVDGEGTETAYVYSDRDLLTSQASEVSGTSSFKYNEHGVLFEETDGRGITVVRTVDAADRVGLVDYPGTTPDTTYSYGSTPTLFDVGRLTSIARGATTVSYTYNPFGELLSDGGLGYVRDKNGNALEVIYPGGLRAIYLYDKMDRPRTLQLMEGTLATSIVPTSPATTYKPYGPLATLRYDLNTDKNLTRGYGFRYQPVNITTSWNSVIHHGVLYTVDDVGNVLQQQRTHPTPVENRDFTYQDYQYYLNSATGPWGSDVWEYDRVGNRIQMNGGAYYYEGNGAGTGNTAKLQSFVPGFAESYSYDHDAGGYLEEFLYDFAGTSSDTTIALSNDASGTLTMISRDNKRDWTVGMEYDGRNFLSELVDEFGTGGWLRPTYSSGGVLHSLERLPAVGGTIERLNVLYFAGAPIAIWKKVGTSTATTTRLITDHLGTPLASIQQAGTAIDWHGGFEPLGNDWQAGTAMDSLAKGIFLRMPGQWKDPLWGVATYKMDLFYNVHRWYETGTGRYTKSDPLGWRGDPNPYAYARSSPSTLADPLGLWSVAPSCKECKVGPCNRQFSPGSIEAGIEESCNKATTPGSKCAQALAEVGAAEGVPDLPGCMKRVICPTDSGPTLDCNPCLADCGSSVAGSYTVMGLGGSPGNPKCSSSTVGLGPDLLHEGLHQCLLPGEIPAGANTPNALRLEKQWRRIEWDCFGFSRPGANQ